MDIHTTLERPTMSAQHLPAAFTVGSPVCAATPESPPHTPAAPSSPSLPFAFCSPGLWGPRFSGGNPLPAALGENGFHSLLAAAATAGVRAHSPPSPLPILRQSEQCNLSWCLFSVMNLTNSQHQSSALSRLLFRTPLGTSEQEK